MPVGSEADHQTLLATANTGDTGHCHNTVTNCLHSCNQTSQLHTTQQLDSGSLQTKMRLPEQLKDHLKSLLVSRRCPDHDHDDVNDVHGTPPGQWPSQSPQPGYLSAILSYFSLALCIIGIITLHRCTYIKVKEALISFQ